MASTGVRAKAAMARRALALDHIPPMFYDENEK
jgi:hypothetical protein